MKGFVRFRSSAKQAGQEAIAVTVNAGPKNGREDIARGTQTVMGLDMAFSGEFAVSHVNRYENRGRR